MEYHLLLVTALAISACPDEGEHNLPREGSCSEYVACLDGVASVQRCPYNSQFDPINQICAPQEQVNCSDTYEKSKTLPIVPTTIPQPPCPTLPATTTNTPDSICGIVDPYHKASFPNNCSHYYMCIFGKAYLDKCPLDLEFSPIIMDCLPPSEAACNKTSASSIADTKYSASSVTTWSKATLSKFNIKTSTSKPTMSTSETSPLGAEATSVTVQPIFKTNPSVLETSTPESILQKFKTGRPTSVTIQRIFETNPPVLETTTPETILQKSKTGRPISVTVQPIFETNPSISDSTTLEIILRKSKTDHPTSVTIQPIFKTKPLVLETTTPEVILRNSKTSRPTSVTIQPIFETNPSVLETTIPEKILRNSKTSRPTSVTIQPIFETNLSVLETTTPETILRNSKTSRPTSVTIQPIFETNLSVLETTTPETILRNSKTSRPTSVTIQPIFETNPSVLETTIPEKILRNSKTSRPTSVTIQPIFETNLSVLETTTPETILRNSKTSRPTSVTIQPIFETNPPVIETTTPETILRKSKTGRPTSVTIQPIFKTNPSVLETTTAETIRRKSKTGRPISVTIQNIFGANSSTFESTTPKSILRKSKTSRPTSVTIQPIFETNPSAFETTTPEAILRKSKTGRPTSVTIQPIFETSNLSTSKTPLSTSGTPLPTSEAIQPTPKTTPLALETSMPTSVTIQPIFETIPPTLESNSVCIENRLYQNDKSCYSYYICHNGNLDLLYCPYDFEFSRSLLWCLPPYLAKCSISTTKHRLPSSHCEEGKLYPDQYSCEHYYKCTDKELLRKKCSNRLEFNSVYNLCLPSSIADCKKNNTSGKKDETILSELTTSNEALSETSRPMVEPKLSAAKEITFRSDPKLLTSQTVSPTPEQTRPVSETMLTTFEQEFATIESESPKSELTLPTLETSLSNSEQTLPTVQSFPSTLEEMLSISEPSFHTSNSLMAKHKIVSSPIYNIKLLRSKPNLSKSDSKLTKSKPTQQFSDVTLPTFKKRLSPTKLSLNMSEISLPTSNVTLSTFKPLFPIVKSVLPTSEPNLFTTKQALTRFKTTLPTSESFALFEKTVPKSEIIVPESESTLPKFEISLSTSESTRRTNKPTSNTTISKSKLTLPTSDAKLLKSESILPMSEAISSRRQSCDSQRLYADNSNCRIYYECRHNRLVTKACPYDYKFSRDVMWCLPPYIAKCSSTLKKSTTKSEECVENKLYPDIENCHLYHECTNGKLQKGTCPYDYNFSEVISACLPSVLAPCHEPTKETQKDKCEFRKDRPISFLPDEQDCRHYYVCFYGVPHRLKCQDDYEFSILYSACLPRWQARCGNVTNTPAPGPCQRTDRPIYFEPKCDSCKEYYFCFNGAEYLEVCPGDTEFSAIHERCMPKYEAKCIAN